MTKLFWHKQTLLLIPTLWFLWNCISYGYSVSLSLDNLKKYEGQVITQDQLKSKSKKPAFPIFQVKLNTYPNQIFKTAIYNSSDSVLLSSAFPIGASVTIYTEPKLLEAFAEREPSQYIVKAQSLGKTVIDKFQVSRDVTKNLILINLVGLFVFGGLYIYKTIRRPKSA